MSFDLTNGFVQALFPQISSRCIHEQRPRHLSPSDVCKTSKRHPSCSILITKLSEIASFPLPNGHWLQVSLKLIAWNRQVRDFPCIFAEQTRTIDEHRRCGETADLVTRSQEPLTNHEIPKPFAQTMNPGANLQANPNFEHGAWQQIINQIPIVPEACIETKKIFGKSSQNLDTARIGRKSLLVAYRSSERATDRVPPEAPSAPNSAEDHSIKALGNVLAAWPEG